MNETGQNWYEQREQSAGALRMWTMWWIYRVFGKTVQKIAFVPAMLFIFPFCGRARAGLRGFYAALGLRLGPWRAFRHLLSFAWSLMDKADACTLRRDLPSVTVRDDASAREFRELTAAGRGLFLVSTHLGTVEALSALPPPRPGATPPFLHAFQLMDHDAVFTGVLMRHFDRTRFALHPVEEIGIETAAEMKDAVARGELVLMAGDRPAAGRARRGANTVAHDFLGRPCRWPKGVFTFARLLECPVFAVVCLRTGWNSYEARFARLDAASNASLLDGYCTFLEAGARARPDQWHHFHDFFAAPG